MKTSIEHIPENKQIELQKVVDIVSKAWSKWVKPEMIILFWSYARWDFVEEDVNFFEWHYEEYKSDFDILVITRKPTQEKNLRVAQEIQDTINADSTLSTPVSLIIEDIYHVNSKLAENRYFYLDIKKEWIVLYDSKKCELWEAKVLSDEEKYAIQKGDYEMWFHEGIWFLHTYEAALKNNYLNNSAFQLHQATEKFITAYMLVKTGYKPKTHDLWVLYEGLQKLDMSFKNWFDFSNENEKHHFDLLRNAYVDARYSKNYKITVGELDFVHAKILIMKSIVEKLCKEELK